MLERTVLLSAGEGALFSLLIKVILVKSQAKNENITLAINVY